jgi:hypothetical protein
MNIMNRTVKNASIALLSLAVAAACLTNVRAADSKTQTQPSPQGTTAKVIMVDRPSKAITVDVHGTIHLLWLSADVKVRKDGKESKLADIVPGQTVTLVTKKTARGDVEFVVEITIEPDDSESEAAGRKALLGKSNEHGKSEDPHGKNNQPHGRGFEQGLGTPPIFAPPAVFRPAVSPHN